MLFERKGRLYIASLKSEHPLPLCNFTIRPIMQVIGSLESRVLMEIKNIKGQSAIIEINTDSMTDLNPFKKEVLRRGHYTFDETAKPFHFARLMNFVFDQLKICHPAPHPGVE